MKIKKKTNKKIKSHWKNKMLLGILGANLLGNRLAGRGVVPAGEGKIRAGQNWKEFNL